MKKAFDQTVRDLKREVNKKVLKVPGVEQKVLDATSNEPWGPHGSSLSDIAQATRNYHEYQMIMAVLWKRINDNGKNWCHVYKALTVLEYLVGHGSERVIDQIKEHAYQISTLSDFQYIDSSGRDQGSNVRKKSQSLVALVSDKERIQEARQKASANREKFRSTNSPGGMYRPGSGGYGDEDRYGSRDDDRNGYGREREYGNKDDDRNSRGGDSYSRDGDRYSRDSDGGYRDDDYNRGRSRSNEDFQSGQRNRSSDKYRERGFDDDGRHSSRSSDARAEDHSQNERGLERKFSEQNIGAPPSYEEAVSDARSPVHDERDGDTPVVETTAKASSPTGSTTYSPGTSGSGTTVAPVNQEPSAFDEFDPRSFAPAAAPPGSNGEMDLLGSLSDALAIVPSTSTTTTSEAEIPVGSASGSTFVALSSASTVLSQPTEDPFGETPFKAIPSAENNQPPQDFSSTANFQPNAVPQSSETFQPAPPQMQLTSSGFDFGDTFEGLSFAPSDVSNVQFTSTSSQFSPSEQNDDVLADILPPSGPTSQGSPFLALPAPTGPPSQAGVPANNFPAHPGYGAPQSHGSFNAPQNPYGVPQGPFGAVGPSQPNIPGHFPPQSGYGAPVASHGGFNAPSGPHMQSGVPGNNFPAQSAYGAPVASQGGFNASSGSVPQQNNNMGNYYQQTGPTTPANSQAATLSVPTGQPAKPQQKDKFETKSTVWADTLSRGLVNLNISGPKTNPLADIGVDFDSINRREKREKPVPQTAVTSTINMGKAMGSGSGMGRAGASALANPMMNSGIGMGMGGGGGMQGMGMGGYGGMTQQQPGMGMPMGMNNMGGMPMGMNNMGMQMGMNNMGGMQMGMNNMGGMQMGGQMRPPQQGPPMAGYNPAMGSGGYPPQNPYGGYR